MSENSFQRDFCMMRKCFFKNSSGRSDLGLTIGRQFVFETGLEIDLDLLQN